MDFDHRFYVVATQLPALNHSDPDLQAQRGEVKDAFPARVVGESSGADSARSPGRMADPRLSSHLCSFPTKVGTGAGLQKPRVGLTYSRAGLGKGRQG